MENEENQKQVFLPSHRPWKSLARFPHFHRADDCSPSQNENKKTKPKGAPCYRPTFFSSGSFFDEKMLSLAAQGIA